MVCCPYPEVNNTIHSSPPHMRKSSRFTSDAAKMLLNFLLMRVEFLLYRIDLSEIKNL